MIASGKRSSRRRAEIVEATLRVISRSGADAVTHRAVAADAGVSLASTTYYFDSKDALVQEALDLVIERSAALVADHTAVDGPISHDELVERLVRLTEAQLEDADAPLVAQYELMIEAGRRPQLRPLAERWEAVYMRSLATLVGASGLPSRRRPPGSSLRCSKAACWHSSHCHTTISSTPICVRCSAGLWRASPDLEDVTLRPVQRPP